MPKSQFYDDPVQGLETGITRPGMKESDPGRDFIELKHNFETFLSMQEGYIFIFSSTGKILYAPQDTLSQLGYKSDEADSLQIFDIYPENQKQFLEQLLQSTLNDQPFISEIPLIDKTGKLISTRSKFKSTVWDGGPAFICHIENTTAQKRLEIELSMLSHALKNVNESLSVFDLNGNIIFVNESFTDTYGYTKQELLGQSINKFHPSEDPRQVFKPIIEKTLKGNWEGELTAKRKNGENFDIFIRTSPVKDEEGTPIVIVGVAQDITEKKLLEAQLRQSQKMEAIGQLAGGIAHDFNNLLTVIEGYTELLFTNTEESDPRQNHIKQIKKASDRAASLTSQLLAFSRRQILQPRKIEINTLVSETSVLFKRLIGADIELTNVLSPDAGCIKADRGQMEQVLMNLAVNARDAMPEGGVLTFETKKVVIGTGYERRYNGPQKGRWVLLTISDNGIGMNAETQERIFEPFFSTKGKDKGTGLGLATVYGIITQSGGSIAVHSEVNKGTTFSIYLPLVESKEKKVSTTPRSAKDLRGNETILVVEDEFMVRELVCDSLRNSGYTIIEAANGKQAITEYKANDKKIDLILSDVIMPEMSGRKMVDTLRGTYPNLRALYMSGYTDDAIIKHGVLEPGMAYIQKPFSPKGLIQKVKEILEEN